MVQTKLKFQEPQVSDCGWVRDLLFRSGYNNAEYSVGLTYLWRRPLHKVITRYKDFFLAKTSVKGNSYLFPAGEGDFEEAVQLLHEDAKEEGTPFCLYSVTPEMRQMLEDMHPGKFEFTPYRFGDDYVYESEKLIELKGRKLHGKRNHIARFMDHNNWSFEEIGPDNLEDCREMMRQWLEVNRDSGIDYSDEVLAIGDAFDHFTELKFSGGLIRVDGKAAAFTVGEPLNQDTFVLHFEKAFSHIQGAYPMINREYAARRLSGYRYINREEDMGLEGLRRAKLSYQPAFLVEKNFAVWRDEV